MNSVEYCHTSYIPHSFIKHYTNKSDNICTKSLNNVVLDSSATITILIGINILPTKRRYNPTIKGLFNEFVMPCFNSFILFIIFINHFLPVFLTLTNSCEVWVFNKSKLCPSIQYTELQNFRYNSLWQTKCLLILTVNINTINQLLS